MHNIKILKKDGRLQEFDKYKIERTIKSASYEAEIGINESDVNILSKDIEEKLSKLPEPISSYSVFGIIINSLVKNGFTQVALAYVKNLT